MPVLTLTAETGMTNLGTLFTTITGWIKDVVGTITSSPVLMLTLGIFVVGAVNLTTCPTLITAVYR